MKTAEYESQCPLCEDKIIVGDNIATFAASGIILFVLGETMRDIDPIWLL